MLNSSKLVVSSGEHTLGMYGGMAAGGTHVAVNYVEVCIATLAKSICHQKEER